MARILQRTIKEIPDQLSTASGDAPSYAARAWVNFNGSTAAINGSGNVTSITKNGNGDYTINLTNNMQDTNYSVSIADNYPKVFPNGSYYASINRINTLNTSSVRVEHYVVQLAAAPGIDAVLMNVVIHR
jgi:hypothetical protein